MLMFVYLVLAMAVTPIVIAAINRKATLDNVVTNRIRGLPVYAISVIVCAAWALIGLVIPGGWPFNLWNFVILGSLIYFGNQFVYQAVVKRFFPGK